MLFLVLYWVLFVSLRAAVASFPFTTAFWKLAPVDGTRQTFDCLFILCISSVHHYICTLNISDHTYSIAEIDVEYWVSSGSLNLRFSIQSANLKESTYNMII